MKKRNRTMRFLSLFSIAALTLSIIVSCGGGGGGGNNISTTSQAASSSSAAMGAVKLSATVGDAADMASGNVPAGYAPGKRKIIDTSDIAKLDPRLKMVVDKMIAELQKPAIGGTMSKARSFKTMNAPMSAPTSTSSGCNISGSISITVDSLVSSGTTTNTLDITFSNCRDYDSFTATYSELNGSMTGTHAFDNINQIPIYEYANMTMNMTDKEYPNNLFTAGSETNTYNLNGVFSSVNNNNASGTNSARGSFGWTQKDPVTGDVTSMTFTIGSGQTPVTEVWSTSTSGGDRTDINTGNGSFSLNVSAPGASLTYGITLTSFEDKLLTYVNGDEDEWFNGSVTVSWSPDLSQWGCANGTYTFTTAPATPVHTPWSSYCPTSGTVKVNNATVQFNANQTVTVSIGGLSQTFQDCESLGNGMCG